MNNDGYVDFYVSVMKRLPLSIPQQSQSHFLLTFASEAGVKKPWQSNAALVLRL